MKPDCLIIVYLFTLSNFSLIIADTCGTGWFGNYCQYKCHCINNQCDTNGINDLPCEKGWFGYKCQYKNILTGTTLLTDENDSTCNSDSSSNSVSLDTQDNLYTFTWMRLNFKSIEPANFYFKLLFKTSQSALTECDNMTLLQVDNKTLDVWCNLNETINQINITGASVKSLCSVYVSGGRNIALKQPTNQSSLYGNANSSLAVDGNTDSLFANKSCTHTSETDKKPTWTVRLNNTFLVNRFVLYNRVPKQFDSDEAGIGDRLKHFLLQVYSDQNDLEVNYTDPYNDIQDIYFINNFTRVSVSSVSILATTPGSKDGIQKYLTLCEVELYGDCPVNRSGLECKEPCQTSCTKHFCNNEIGTCICLGFKNPPDCNMKCDVGYWGLNCANNCTAKCWDSDCNPETGLCQSGCNGFQDPPVCKQICEKGTWGLNCSRSCHTNCYNTSCNRISGVCDFGCQAGFESLTCEKECDEGKWGENCVSNCTQCWLSQCNKTTGLCDAGCHGFRNPPICNQSCEKGTWGFNCSQSCNINCYNTSCDRISGVCNLGCQAGFESSRCDKGFFLSAKCDEGKWGENCISNCTQCWQSQCNKTSGLCEAGCHGFRNPPTCNESCPIQTWGVNCSQSCSSHCANTSCDSTTGTCDFGCLIGFQGILCNVGKILFFILTHLFLDIVSMNMLMSRHRQDFCCLTNKNLLFVSKEIPKNESSPSNVGVIVGPIVAAVLLIALIIVLIVFCRRRQRTHKNTRQSELNPALSLHDKPADLDMTAKRISLAPLHNDNDKSVIIENETSTDNEYVNTVNTNTSIPVAEFNNFMATHNATFFTQQFQAISSPDNVSTEYANNVSNKLKNRYKNICTYDHSRVNLKINTDKDEGDYINASYIRGYNDQVEFIASQGPNKTILNDFVRMLWEQNVEKVVMLTNLTEEGKMKCEQYWPAEGKTSFGDIKMRLVSSETLTDYTIRHLEMTKKNEVTHHLTQYHFHTWPDKGVPEAPWSLLNFIHRISTQTTAHHIVVHCSAGVGRTGTFIAIHNLLRQAKETGRLDFFKIVSRLREDRVFMVQTATQFEFLHKVVQAALLTTDTTIQVDGLTNTENGINSLALRGIDSEFKTLCSVCDIVNKSQVTTEDGNETTDDVYQNTLKISQQEKNRFPSLVPRRQYRPYLECDGSSLADYINAVFVPGLKQKDQHFLTQLPMPGTVDDFWRLVIQYKITIIVDFEFEEQKDDSTIANYVPISSNASFKTELFEIASHNHKQTLVWDEQNLTVSHVDQTRELKHEVFHIRTGFKDLNTMKWVQLIKHLQLLNVSGKKVAFLCRNGAKWSGLACTLCLMLERMDNESYVNIPLIVGALKFIRPEVILTVADYRVLYEVLERYTETSSQYTNVGNKFLKEML
ncbi:uncharacterized protein LOC106052861 [Biomphalaria glabrata]|uniref:protein-tyrosine-phosphatase n=1 Tax=Biomphalaria glabrata TaxID=6526 RepID=A0A9W3ABF7_BIOGL|nr:uncharacterized protein LOC106052861 [Biomphalaria glabrata]